MVIMWAIWNAILFPASKVRCSRRKLQTTLFFHCCGESSSTWPFLRQRVNHNAESTQASQRGWALMPIAGQSSMSRFPSHLALNLSTPIRAALPTQPAALRPAWSQYRRKGHPATSPPVVWLVQLQVEAQEERAIETVTFSWQGKFRRYLMRSIRLPYFFLLELCKKSSKCIKTVNSFRGSEQPVSLIEVCVA